MYAQIIGTKLSWCLYFFAAKFQLTIGYRSGFFSYLSYSPPAKHSMRSIEQRAIHAAARLGLGFEKRQLVGETVLFATSFVAPKGGHTRLLQTFLSQMPNTKLLVSGDAFFVGRKHFLAGQEYLCSTLFDNAEDRVTFNKPSKLLPCRQIELLYQHLSNIRPRVIVLFNEPSDLALLIATLSYIRTNTEAQAYYYHHADDFLAFLGGAFHGHIDLDRNQEAKCKDTPNRSLIRISAKNRKTETATVAKPFTVFSFAPMTKLKSRIPDANGYADLVSALSRKGVRFIIATKNGEGRALYGFLERSGTDMEVVSIDEQCFDISKYAGLVHAYLDTFPVGGGMSVVDGLSLSIPVMINALHGNQVFRDEAIKDFMFASSLDIFNYVMLLKSDAVFYRQQSKHAHQIFMNTYDESAMIDSLSSLIARNCKRLDNSTT